MLSRKCSRDEPNPKHRSLFQHYRPGAGPDVTKHIAIHGLSARVDWGVERQYQDAMIELPQTTEVAEVPVSGETLVDRLRRIVERRGSDIALCSDLPGAKPRKLTYSQLAAGIDLWSRTIAAQDGAAGDRVAILMRHDVAQAAALLSVLKAGRIVVVLNPTDPQARLRATVEDAAPGLIIADHTNLQLADAVAQGICPCLGWDRIEAGSPLAPTPPLNAEATAFIVYTSGSAGRPKGVMLNHQQVLHNAWRLSSAMQLASTDRIALLPSLSGLHGVNILWCALLCGAALLPFPVMDWGVTGLADWMVTRDITAFSASTSLFRSFMRSLRTDQQLATVRAVRIGGELATSDDVLAFRQHFRKEAVLLNTLALSEAGNVAYFSFGAGETVPDGPLAVGRPFDGIELQIIGVDGRPAAPGDAGEIVVHSPYIAQGYWRDAALTAKRFFRDPQAVPMLHSGDLGRINGDGIVEFLGRSDTRVKIHGFSVELEEVELALRRAPGVERTVVSAFESRHGAELVAYVQPRGGAVLTSASLRRAMRELLPWYMVPSIFQIIGDFPLTPHGKVDRGKLLESLPPVVLHSRSTGFETENEALVASIWSEAFGLQAVGRDENFFELGGDSLTASMIAARIYSDTGAELDLGAFAQHPTIATQATLVDRIRGRPPGESPIRRLTGNRTFPLSFAQQRIWEFCQTESGVASYAVLARYRVTGPLDVARLRRCMNFLAKRHEPLRTTFHAADTGPVQAVHPAGEVALKFVDVALTPDPAAAVDEEIDLIKNQKFDLGRLPLVRFTLMKIAPNEHLLLRQSHHILYDGSAWTLYFDELADLYTAEMAGRGVPAISGADLQYGDYAAWQRQSFCAEASASERLIGWWLRILDRPPEPAAWPARRPQPVKADPSEGYLSARIAPAAWQEMNALASRQHVTIFCGWLAAFGAFLSAQADRGDAIVGTYVSNRKRPELQTMFGDFSNLVTLRLSCELKQTFRSSLMATREAYAAATAHSEVPYEELRRAFAREQKTLPEIRTIILMDVPMYPSRFAGLEMITEDGAPQGVMPWGFTMLVKPKIPDCDFAFDASIYDPNLVRHGVAQWRRFVDALLYDPDAPIAQALTLANVSTGGSLRR